MNNQEIIEIYLAGESLAGVSRLSGMSVYKIKKLLTENNIHIRSRSEQNVFTNQKRSLPINHNYFDILTTENVYYLGFIAADGTVRPKRNEIKIGLSSVDKEFLEEFREKLQSERTIKDYETANGFQVSELIFSSLNIKQQLMKYSIAPNKTEIGITMKHIPAKFKLAFIKGFFDGDGSFSFNINTKQCMVKFTSHTLGILEEINVFFDSKGKCYQKQSNGVCYSLEFSTLPSLNIMKQFYDCDSPCLLRKKNKYEEALKQRIKI